MLEILYCFYILGVLFWGSIVGMDLYNPDSYLRRNVETFSIVTENEMLFILAIIILLWPITYPIGTYFSKRRK